MKRTQIYLDEEQDSWLTDRAAEVGSTKSQLIRDAIDRFRASPVELDPATRRARWRESVRATAGIAAYLPSGSDYVRQLREADAVRDGLLEQRWGA